MPSPLSLRVCCARRYTSQDGYTLVAEGEKTQTLAIDRRTNTITVSGAGLRLVADRTPLTLAQIRSGSEPPGQVRKGPARLRPLWHHHPPQVSAPCELEQTIPVPVLTLAHSRLPRRHHQAHPSRARSRHAHLLGQRLLRFPNRPLEHRLPPRQPGRGVPPRPRQGAPLQRPVLLHLRRLRSHEPPSDAELDWETAMGVGALPGTSQCVGGATADGRRVPRVPRALLRPTTASSGTSTCSVG